MSRALPLESYFRHNYRVSWFHRIRKNCHFSRTSKPESYEQVQAAGQPPLINSAMYTRLHLAPPVCCMHRWKSEEPTPLPVPRHWRCRAAQRCGGDGAGCSAQHLQLASFINRWRLYCPAGSQHLVGFVSSVCGKEPLFLFYYSPGKRSVYGARSQTHISH